MKQNNGFPFLDIFRYLKNTKPENPKIWKSETSPNLGTWLGISWLGLVSLCQIWDFYGYKYPKISKNGNPLFFPVILKFLRLNLLLWVYELANSFYLFRVYIF